MGSTRFDAKCNLVVQSELDIDSMSRLRRICFSALAISESLTSLRRLLGKPHFVIQV